MAFPQSWRVSDHVSRQGFGLVLVKTNKLPKAVSVVADACIPSKYIIESSPILDPRDDMDFDYTPLPNLLTRIDSKSGVPNSSTKSTNVPAASTATDPATDLTPDRLSITRRQSSDSFIEENGLSRSMMNRRQVLEIRGPIYYFEVTPTSDMTCDTSDYGVTIGLAAVSTVKSGSAHQCSLDIGYHSSGNFIPDQAPALHQEVGFGVHDTVGCGLEIGGRGRAFFTCNGRVIGEKIFPGFGIQGESYYPVIILQGSGITVKTNMGASSFVFSTDGLNICNYAFAFNKAALLKSARGASKSGTTLPLFEEPSNIESSLDTHISQWSSDDAAGVSTSLQMLEQVIKSHLMQDAVISMGQIALESNDADLNAIHKQDESSRDMNTTAGVVDSGVRSGQGRKLSKNAYEIVQMVVAYLSPLWHKLVDTINKNDPSNASHLQELLLLNDKITVIANQLESLFDIKVPHTTSQSSAADAPASVSKTNRRARGFTEPVLATSRFSWRSHKQKEDIEEEESIDVKSHPKSIESGTPKLGPSDFNFSDLNSLSSTTDSMGVQKPSTIPRINRQDTRTQIKLPSLDSLLKKLRGTAEDVSSAADLIYSIFSPIAGVRRRSKSLGHSEYAKDQSSSDGSGLLSYQCKFIREIVDHGGFIILLQALTRCTEWPEVEIKVIKAVTVLTIFETDYNMILRKSNDILTAMNLLLLKMKPEQSSADMELDCDTKNVEKANGAELFRELVAMAAANICSVIHSHWEEEEHGFVHDGAPVDAFKNDPTASGVEAFPAVSTGLHRTISESSKTTKATSNNGAQDLIRTIEALLHVIILLLHPNGPDGNDSVVEISKSTVICCEGICRLVQVTPLKQRIAAEDILKSLISWVNICTEAIYNSMPERELNPLYWDLIEQISCIFCLLCKAERKEPIAPSGGESFARSYDAESTYATGYIDAQMTALGVPKAMADFIKRLSPDVFAEPQRGVCLTDQSEDAEDFVIVSSKSLRSTPSLNEHLVSLAHPVIVPAFFSSALMRSTAVHFAEALSSLSNRPNKRVPMISSALCTLLVTAAAQTSRHKRSRFNNEFPTEEYGPEKLQQMHNRDMEEDGHLGKCANACLNGLSYFVADALNKSPPLVPVVGTRSSDRVGRTEVCRGKDDLPPVIRMLLSFNVLDALKLVATLNNCEARLAAFRLISMLSEWPAALEQMVSMNITEILLSFLKDRDDVTDQHSRFGTSPTPSVASTPMGITRPKSIERGVSGDTARSGHSEDICPPISSISSHFYIEEILRVLYFIAQACEYSFHNAAKLYDDGLMRVALNVIKHYGAHVEIYRQALRSVSAMCPVLSSITPGGHPAQVVEKLTSAKENADLHLLNNATHKEIVKTRLETNLLIFVEALRALAYALLSQSSLVQKEALRGISLLAVDDQLRVGIVEGPLKEVIKIFVNPSTEEEVKDLAEQVFINIGFHNGRRDLEIVGNDSELLSDWFYMKRSMRPQSLAYDLTRHWIDALFFGDEQAEQNARKHFIRAELGLGDIPITSDEADSLSLRIPGGMAIDIRDTLDLAGLSVLKKMLEKIAPQVRDEGQTGLYWGSLSGSPSELRNALHEQFLFLFDSWQMLNQIYLADHVVQDHYSHSGMLYSPYIDTTPTTKHALSTPSAAAPSSTSGSLKKRIGFLLSETFVRYVTHCSSRLTAHKILEEEEEEERENKEAAERQLMGRLSHIDSASMFNSPSLFPAKQASVKGFEVRPIRKLPVTSTKMQTAGLKPLYENFSARVVDLLDFIFPSKMFQLYLNDLIACAAPDGDECFAIPKPKQFRALLLPPRSYPSFHREGRIVQRILDDIKTKGYQSEKPTFHYTANVLTYGTADNLKESTKTATPAATGSNSVLWAIAFRDSKFDGEFFTTFLSTINKCPSISVLSFVSAKATPDDRKLGYLAGNVPPTVRFLIFEGSLCSDSLQIMCLLLKTQNAAWNIGNIGKNRKGGRSNSKSDPQTDDGSDRGLQGLAIRQHQLFTDDVKHICDLLDPSGESLKFGIQETSKQSRITGLFGGSSHIQTVVGTLIDENASLKEVIPIARAESDSSTQGSQAGISKCGLKYLDLSDNCLSDSQCADILKCAAVSPLECIELGGNSLQKALYFIPSLKLVCSQASTTLKHLGVSSCCLDPKTFCGILQCITQSKSLTSFDASSNGLWHTDDVKQSLHDLLKHNRSLRLLDISNNDWDNDTIRAIHLGLIENENVMLMINITPTLSMNSQELLYIRDKLYANRETYAKQRSATSTAHYRHNSIAPYLGINKELSISTEDDTSPSAGRATFDVGADGISHTISLPAHLMSAPGLSRDSSVASSQGDASRASPIKRSNSDLHIISPGNRSRTSSRDDIPAARVSLNENRAPQARPPRKVESRNATISVARSISNPLITISDTCRQRSGSGVSSRQEAIEAVARFSVDKAELFEDTKDRTAESSHSQLSLVEGIDASDVYAVPVASAVTTAQEALVIGTALTTNPVSAAFISKGGTVAAPPEHADAGVIVKAEPYVGDNESPKDVLWVLFSAPLAWRNVTSGDLRPIEMLNYKSEQDTLHQVFRDAQRDIDLKFSFATTNRLQAAVTLGCRALHFSGHGHPEWLNFEDGFGGLQMVSVEELRRVCSAGESKQDLEFVFVSACFSLKAGEAFAAAGVPHVVCVSVDAQLLDTAATTFTRAFYLALIVGKSVRQAFENGQNAVSVSPSVPNGAMERGKFKLLPENMPHDEVIFRASRVPKWPRDGNNHYDPSALDRLPGPPEDFEGREVDMYKVISAFCSRHLVSIVGDRGVGKSAVAAAVMRYQLEREVFEHGAIHVLLQSVSTYDVFLDTFQRAMTMHCPAAAEELEKQRTALNIDDSVGVKDGSRRFMRDPMFTKEDLLIASISSLKVLIVLDHVDTMLSAAEVADDFKSFLGKILKGTGKIYVLVTSTVGIGMQQRANRFGDITEVCIKLGPLSLYNSLRLFARLAPSLATAKQKFNFIQSLLPKIPPGVDPASTDFDEFAGASTILELFGNGHPNNIIKLAVESTNESVQLLRKTGSSILASAAAAAYVSDPSHRPLLPGDLSIHISRTTSTPRSPGKGSLTADHAAFLARPQLGECSSSVSSMSDTSTYQAPVMSSTPNIDRMSSAITFSTPLNHDQPLVEIDILEYFENDVTDIVMSGKRNNTPFK